MFGLHHIWIIVTDVAHSLFGAPLLKDGLQYPLGSKFNLPHITSITNLSPDYPDFIPYGSNIDRFRCQYPTLIGWEYCGNADNQSCWLRNPSTGEEYNINTDYEDKMPPGVPRIYTLNVTDGVINANGLNFYEAKMFNNSFPGPLIEACWGDQVLINVTNYLTYNGTSIHWHGIRQFQTMHMDGVNGITQCPIAPNDWFLYNWTATQYGSSWYHSHYSVQYADGLQAPITIHGPTSFPYDEAVEPITVTDWANNSAFSFLGPDPPYMQQDILLGGRGNITRFSNNTVTNTTEIRPGFELVFEPLDTKSGSRAKRYLLRIINTAFDSMFVFSIDNHNFTVVEADFVPIEPYNTTSILIAIGQRYHIIVEANPVTNSSDPSANPLPPKDNNNFWIRTWVPTVIPPHGKKRSCGEAGVGGSYMNTGILRYDETSTADPITEPWVFTDDCSDTTFQNNFKPVVPWTVGPPANGEIGEQFNVAVLTDKGQGSKGPYGAAFFGFDGPNNEGGPLVPFQTTYGNPTFLNLDNVGDEWPAGWVIVPENYTDSDWIYLVLNSGGSHTFGPHPIHLHGHDFAIVQEDDSQLWDPSLFNPNLDNPPRRDVVLLPLSGFAVIAFKADNPGVWLMHCHIALHASAGLSLQIMERQAAANALWPPGQSPALDKAHRVCAKWNTWAYDCKNYWPGNNGTKENPEYPSCDENLQNDSGV